MSMKIIKPGMLSQFQDGGRWGYQSLGVSVCGAMDLLSHQLANLIVGNTEDLATLEITLIGPTLTFSDSCCVCLAGADMQAKLNGKPVTRYRPLIISPGDTMTLPQAKEGTRAYLAAYGGFAITPLLGSQSTYLRSGFGGWHGRGLKAGDEIALNISLPTTSSARQALSETLWNKRIYLPSVLGIWASRKSIVRWIRSEDWSDLTTESQAAMHKTAWRVANDADRMGFRLDGPKINPSERKRTPIRADHARYDAVARFWPTDCADGGSADHGWLPSAGLHHECGFAHPGSKKPGDRVHFMAIDLDQASALDAARQEALKELSVQLTSMRHCIADAAIPTPLQED